jgi:hypothetical protein
MGNSTTGFFWKKRENERGLFWSHFCQFEGTSCDPAICRSYPRSSRLVTLTPGRSLTKKYPGLLLVGKRVPRGAAAGKNFDGHS